MVVWDPHSVELEEEAEHQQKPRPNKKPKAPPGGEKKTVLQLEIPGIGIARLGQHHAGTNLRSPILRIQARSGQIQPVEGVALSLNGIRFGSTV
jgi:hypothetical protein